MRRARGLLLLMAFLVGCPPPETRVGTGTADRSAGSEEIDDQRDRPELLRAGVITLGEYLFEQTDAEGRPSRVRGELLGVGAGDLEVRLEGRPATRLSRRATWPMLCLGRRVSFEDGDLRITLERGAPVYVIASDGRSVRMGPVPDVTHSRIVPRSELSLEACDEPTAASPGHFVRAPRAEDAACLFPDQDPADETDGLAVSEGAPLELLEDDGDWSRVRVLRPGVTLEGWIDARLVTREAGDPPDWSAASLRADRCLFPGRATSTVTSQAWVESSDAGTPLASATIFQDTLVAADPRVRGCWDELPAERRPTRTARVEVRISVDGDGQVNAASVVRAEAAPEALARCILERVRRVRFPAPRTGVVLRRTYAFDPPAPAPSPEGGEDDLDG